MTDDLPLNQRNAQRFKTDFAAKVESEFFCIHARVTNISSGGLQLTCDFHALQEMMPNIKRPDRFLPIKFFVQFFVPTRQQEAAQIQIDCSLIYTRRAEENLAVVGCQFTHIDDLSGEALKDYLLHFASRD